MCCAIKKIRFHCQGTAVEVTVVLKHNQVCFPNLPDGRQERPVPMNEVISGAVNPVCRQAGFTGLFFVTFFCGTSRLFRERSKKVKTKIIYKIQKYIGIVSIINNTTHLY